MTIRICCISISILFFSSLSYGQLTTESFTKKFNSSVLVTEGNSINKNSTNLKYYSISMEDNLDSTNYNSAGYRSFKIGKQIVLSQIYGAIFGVGFGFLGAVINPNLGLGGIYVMYGGYITGMMLGVHIVGNDKYESASFVNSLLGGLIGLSIGIIFYNSDPIPSGFNAVAPFAFPTIGTVISFNLLAKPK